MASRPFPYLNRRGFVAGVLLLGSCGGEKPAAETKTKPSLPDLPNAIAEDVRFPSADRKSMSVVSAPLLGMEILAGGNLAEYAKGDKQWKLFTIRCRNATQAGSYLFTIKAELKDPKFVASYGGYFAQTPQGGLLVFAKNQYVAGIVGLDEAEAIETGKLFGARL
jgi:hypothetical protein